MARKITSIKPYAVNETSNIFNLESICIKPDVEIEQTTGDLKIAGTTTKTMITVSGKIGKNVAGKFKETGSKIYNLTDKLSVVAINNLITKLENYISKMQL